MHAPDEAGGGRDGTGGPKSDLDSQHGQLEKVIPISRPSSANDTSDDKAESSTDEGVGPVSELKTADPLRPGTGTAADQEPEQGYLEGIQLGIVTACVTLVCFLVLLDTSIIATVSIASRKKLATVTG